jgi:hypothetical protein
MPCMPTMALRDRLRHIQAHTSLSDGSRSVLEKEAGREDPFWPQNSDGNFRHCRSFFKSSLLRSFVPSSTQSRTPHPTVAITVLLLCSGWHFFSHLLSGSECHATRPAAMTKTGFLKRRWRSSTPRTPQAAQDDTTSQTRRHDTLHDSQAGLMLTCELCLPASYDFIGPRGCELSLETS